MVETVGVDINYDDMIKFESFAIQGQFLHSSDKHLDGIGAHSAR